MKIVNVTTEVHPNLSKQFKVVNICVSDSELENEIFKISESQKKEICNLLGVEEADMSEPTTGGMTTSHSKNRIVEVIARASGLLLSDVPNFSEIRHLIINADNIDIVIKTNDKGQRVLFWAVETTSNYSRKTSINYVEVTRISYPIAYFNISTESGNAFEEMIEKSKVEESSIFIEDTIKEWIKKYLFNGEEVFMTWDKKQAKNEFIGGNELVANHPHSSKAGFCQRYFFKNKLNN